MELTDEEIVARIAALETPEQTVADYTPREYRYFEPLENAADEWVHWARHPERRIYTGIRELDASMRGTAPGEMTLIVGYAHSGKTVVTTQIILNARDRRIVLFTPDETRVLVTIKLCSIIHGISAEELERRVGMADPEAEQLVRETASKHFPLLAVFDESLSLSAMDTALDECEEWWGGPADAVIYDYVELLEGTETVGKINALKAWGRKRDVPLFALHQSSRTKGSSGSKVTIDSGGFGGEQQATHMIGVRRKRSQINAQIAELEEKIRTAPTPRAEWADQLDLLRHDLKVHANTITVSLVKTKRPPCRLVDDLDYNLDENTGRISPIVYQYQQQNSYSEYEEYEMF